MARGATERGAKSRAAARRDRAQETAHGAPHPGIFPPEAKMPRRRLSRSAKATTGTLRPWREPQPTAAGRLAEPLPPPDRLGEAAAGEWRALAAALTEAGSSPGETCAPWSC